MDAQKNDAFEPQVALLLRRGKKNRTTLQQQEITYKQM